MHKMTTAAALRRASWFKRIFLGAIIAALLLAGAFFVGTSSAFLKAVVLPRAGKALNAKVTAEEIAVSPMSQARIRGLRVETTGGEPLLAAAEVRVRYSLMDILKGNIAVSEVTVASPVVSVVQEANGASNLDPILQSQAEPAGADKAGAGKPLRLDVRNVSIKNGLVRHTQKLAGGGVSRFEAQGLELSLDRLGNGQSGELKLSAKLAAAQTGGPGQNGAAGEMAADLSGGYTVALTQDLLPEKVQGSLKLAIHKGEGTYGPLAGLGASLDADLTPKEIRRAALQFAKNGKQLGAVRISGPMDAAKKEGNLRIEIASIDKNVLALAGSGLDFRNSMINSTNQVTISQEGNVITALGNLAGSQVSVAKGELATPEVSLRASYEVAANTKDKLAIIRQLNLGAQQGGAEFARVDLDKPMNLTWGESTSESSEAALKAALTNFDLSAWRAVLGTNVQSGMVSATASIVSGKNGRALQAEITAKAANLTAQSGPNRIENAEVTAEASGTVEELKNITLPKFAVAVKQQGASVLQATGAVRYGLESKEAAAQITAEAALPQALALAKVPGARASAGLLKASASFSEGAGKRKAVGNLSVGEFTGGYEAYAFTNFQTTLDFNFEMDGPQLTINRAAAAFSQGFNAGGAVEVRGGINTQGRAGQLFFSVSELNQNFFGPVLGPALAGNQLVSINLTAAGELKMASAEDGALKAEAKIENWVVKDKAGQLPTEPLTVEFKLDGSVRQQAIDLRQMLVQLTPTERAKNSLELQAKLDFAKTNPAPSTLSLRAESLDVTTYYNLFAGGGSSATPSKPAAIPAADANQEPEAMDLPLKQLTAEMKIDRFYLREVAITNWVGNVVIRSNTVALRPFQMQVNGGAVNAEGDLDLGVPGYKYDLGFKADAVPLGPLANSFAGGEPNRLHGTFLADARVRGAGVTGASLKKTLGGNFSVNMTNMEYHVAGPKLRAVLYPISIALRVPEVLETPLNWVAVQGEMGSGAITVKQLGVESEAFFASGAGAVTLADVLTNSPIQLPLEVALRRSLAQKTRLLPEGTPPEARYAALPRFVSVKGTLGAPSPEIDKLVLAGLIAKGAAGLGLNFGSEAAGKVGSTVGNLLGGAQSAITNATGNPGNPVGNLLGGLGGLIGGKKEVAPAPAAPAASASAPPPPSTNNAAPPAAPASTNAPAAKASGATNQPGVFDLLRGLKKKEN